MRENKKKKTPSLANWLVSKLIKDGLHEEFLGDLEEIYQYRTSTKGRRYAKWMYWVDALHLLIGFTSIKLFSTQNNPTIMYKHYLTIAHRNLLRNKLYSLINILSLAVGMGVCLLICQYIYFELSYDKFHSNYENTYRIIIEETKNGEKRWDPYTGYAVGIGAKKDIPEIEQYVRMHEYIGTVVTNPDNNKAFHEDGHALLFVDSTFLRVFNFPLKLGTKESIFAEKFNIVITERMAEKYFGTDNPIGKTLIVSTQPSPGNYTVTGVLEELPINSNLQFDFLLPIGNYLDLGWGGAVKKNSDGWVDWVSFVTYLTLDESANLNLVQEKLDQLIARHKGAKNAHLNIEEKAELQPIGDIHLKSDSYADAGYIMNKGSIQDIRVFAMIAFFILFIAWVNYINLSTARSIYRKKEVGVRKSIGAFRKQLIGQFMIESVLVNLLSALLAIGIAFLALPILSQIIGKELELSLLQIPIFWVWFLAIILLGSLLSGLYPAFVLSSFKPVSMLGANKPARAGNFNLRQSLIAFQFLTSLLLIAGTYLVYKQITFMKNQELGMDIEKILVLKGPEVDVGTNLRSTFQAFKNEVADHHSITAVAGSVFIPSQVNNTRVEGVRKLGEPESEAPYGQGVYVDSDFPKTYGLEFIAGSSFTPDMSDEEYVIINEEAVRAYGLGSPENALQEQLIGEEGTYSIIGVVKNFHWSSLRVAQTPFVFWFEGNAHSHISFKMNLSNIPESLAYIEKTYQSFFPGNPFEYFFLDDAFNRQYQVDVQFGNLFFAFTILAIFIACIGLFALVSYSATLRIKEIGIRKVLGANVSDLMLLLSREYLMLLSIAIVLAIPAILYWGNSWLENYAFRIDIGLDFFIIPALILVLISLLTVSHRTYSAAKANPVESLRVE